MVSRALAASLGVVADRLLGEPPPPVHPVVAFGRVMRSVEGTLYRDTRPSGVAHAAIGAGLGVVAG